MIRNTVQRMLRKLKEQARQNEEYEARLKAANRELQLEADRQRYDSTMFGGSQKARY